MYWGGSWIKPEDQFSREWTDAIDNIENPSYVSKLGMYHYKQINGPQSDEIEDIIESFAHLLGEAFVKVQPADLANLMENLEGNGDFLDPCMWEDPENVMSIHKSIEDELGKGQNPYIQQLSQVAHDLEYFVRPNLGRIYWLVSILAGKPKKYSECQMETKSGVTGVRTIGNLVHKINDIKWIPNGEEETFRSLDEFSKGLKKNMSDPDQLGIDLIRNWIDHRNYLIGKNALIIPINTSQAKPRKISFDEITRLRRTTLGLIDLMKAFQVMFFAHAVSLHGDFSPFPLFDNRP